MACLVVDIIVYLLWEMSAIEVWVSPNKSHDSINQGRQTQSVTTQSSYQYSPFGLMWFHLWSTPKG